MPYNRIEIIVTMGISILKFKFCYKTSAHSWYPGCALLITCTPVICVNSILVHWQFSCQNTLGVPAIAYCDT